MTNRPVNLSLSDDLLDKVKRSGVDNLSKHVTRLLAQELASTDSGLNTIDQDNDARLRELKHIEEAWDHAHGIVPKRKKPLTRKK